MKIPVDVFCLDSSRHDIPIWTDIQAEALEESGLFDIQAIRKCVRKEHVLHWSKVSDTVICMGIDQHSYDINFEFLKEYKYKIFVVDEPVYSHVCQPDKMSPLEAHQGFQESYQPDILLYSCKRELHLSPVNGLFWTNLIDHYILKKRGLDVNTPWAEYRNQIPQKQLLGVVAYSQGSVNYWPGRGASIQAVRDAADELPICLRELVQKGETSYIKVTDLVQKSSFVFLPTHAVPFHNLRFLHSWWLGSVPIVVNQDGWLDDPLIGKLYGDFVDKHNYKTCILTSPDKLKEDLKKYIVDRKQLSHLLYNIKHLDMTEFGWKNVMQTLYNEILRVRSDNDD